MKNNQVKNWSEIKSNDSWALFKIMSEFVEGYETLSAIGPCISIFGSARTQEGDSNYQLTIAIAEAIAESGYGVISGGGPGIMEAANRGAQGETAPCQDAFILRTAQPSDAQERWRNAGGCRPRQMQRPFELPLERPDLLCLLRIGGT